MAAKYVAEYRATGENDKISAIISSTVLLSLSLCLAGTAVVVVFARTIVVDVLLIPPALQTDAVTGLYLACATIVSITLGQIFQFVLQGLQRFDRYLLVTNLSAVMSGGGGIILVLNGFGVIALLYLNLFTVTVIGLFSFFLAVKLLPEFKFSFRIQREMWRPVYRYAASIIAYQTFGNILLLFERGWIMRKFGPEALAYYAVPMALAMYVHLFTASLVLGLFPMVNELLTHKARLVTLYQKSTKLILTLVTFAVISVVAGGRLFLGLWLSDEFAAVSYEFLVIHVFSFALLALGTVVWQVAESFRAAALNAFAAFAWMAVSVPLMILLADRWQTTGIAVARLAGVLVFIPLIFYVEKRFLGGVYWRFWGFVATRIAFAAALAFSVEYLIVSTMGRGWLTFVFAVTAGFLVYLTGLVVIGFLDDEEKQLIRAAIAL